MTARLNTWELNTVHPNNQTGVPSLFFTEMGRLQDSHPLIKIELVESDGTVHNISDYYLPSVSFEQIKERAPDEIQAGSFDIILNNHDDYFSEFNSDSVLYQKNYHGFRIKVYVGFRLPNGTETYEIQCVGFIDQLTADPGDSKITFRCRDRIRDILDQKLHRRPLGEVAVAGGSNVGNGLVSTINTKPFKTKNETWTLTCTLGGADGVATFSVVGSVTGAKPAATSGTEYSTGTGTGGLKFTISAGTINWAIGDVFTFTTKQYPEWDAVNAVKIIWSILTGYNYDANTQEVWSSEVLSLDHAQSDSNTDIDYNSFVTAIANVASLGAFDLTGYVEYDETASDVIQDLILLFLGSVFTAADGRIKIKTYVPNAVDSANVVASFSDTKKITLLGYGRTIDEVINYVSIHYKKTKVFEFSDQEVNLDGNYVALFQDSIDLYGFLTEGFSTRWYSANGSHAQDFASRLVGKYSIPPLTINFETGLDALLVEIGDVIEVTDEKYSLANVRSEISRIGKNLASQPIAISLRSRRDTDVSALYGFLGSRIDEGDGLSPQATTYGAASASDKQFCYLGALSGTTPDYKLY